jgi:two-component system cell cycle sensor histidine kinase/response regulator CckA
MATILKTEIEEVSRSPSKLSLRIPMAEESPQEAKLILDYLRNAGYVLFSNVVQSREHFQERIDHEDFDLIISDHDLRTWTGLDALEILRRSGKDIPFIVVTGTLGDEAAAGYIKRGAADYILKRRLNLLSLTVAHVLQEKEHRNECSKRHLSEHALRLSVDRYRSLVVASAQVVWTTNAAGEVVEDLPLWRAFTGKSVAESLGRGWLNAIHPEDREQTGQVWSNAVKSRCNYTSQFRALRNDGEYRDLLARGVPVLEDDGSVREWVGTCTDITDQRQLEDQSRQDHKMEAMGKLAGGIAHDFNNLLGVIIGYSDLLLSSIQPGDASRREVEQIKKAGQRAAALTLQLLAFSRKQVLMPKVLDLNQVVRETSKMLLRLIGEHIELVTTLNPTLDHVRADPTQIEQVIVNLAINARDAMPNGGKLVIQTLNAELEQSHNRYLNDDVKPGNYVLLTVSDTGTGMDKETQARIFEPFFTTKGKGKGTGLGLATVYGIVKQSSGYIWVYSEVGKGTVLKVYMPRVQGALSQVQLEAAPPPPCSGTILLVEDEDSLRDLNHKLLESMGYTVIEAANGADAIRVGGRCRDRIQLLITDVVMPGMTGRELAERLVASDSKMKVLYVSGYTEDGIMQTLAPGVAFLQKPFTRDSLAKKIQESLGISNETLTIPGGDSNEDRSGTRTRSGDESQNLDLCRIDQS